MNNIPDNINFNCDINIRPNDSEIFYFKTTAKIATAAILGHNIITTYDMAIKDILPPDYPFILEDNNLATIIKMIELIRNDYNKDKYLWNKGLTIMYNVKQQLSLDNIIFDYIDIIS